MATLGPASGTPEVITELVRAGVDVTRFNFSHGSHEGHQAAMKMVREVESAAGRPIAVLQDLQGPKIRLGKLDGKVTLAVGATVVLSSDNDFLGNADRIPTTYERLAADVRRGDRILLADGQLVLTAKEIKGRDVVAEVVVGGVVSSNKGLNMPGSELSIPSLTEKDIEDLEAGLAMGVDYVALSFVRMPHDVTLLRNEMRRLGRVVPIISKIEKPQAVEFLEAITELSDGIMVARGDLGVELPPEAVPGVQRRAIRLARERGKFTIVATQMLVSMTNAPRPTHAEVSDVANAVFHGTDAVMLSEETAAGKYPVKTVETMAEIVRAADHASTQAEPLGRFVDTVQDSYPGVISRAAVLTADDMKAEAIVAFTDRGLGPRLISAWRPRSMILGCASTVEATRRMNLYWGVKPMQIAAPNSFEELVQLVEEAAGKTRGLHAGAKLVITTKMPFDASVATNVLKLHTLGGDARAEES